MSRVYRITNNLLSIYISCSDLINLAQLVGSDYTEGVVGVGLVAACEIIAFYDNLAIFKSDVDRYKRYLDEGGELLAEDGETNSSDAAYFAAMEEDKRNLLKRVVNISPVFPDTFPNQEVATAYLQPRVMMPRDAARVFRAVPIINVRGLQEYGRAKFLWYGRVHELC